MYGECTDQDGLKFLLREREQSSDILYPLSELKGKHGVKKKNKQEEGWSLI